MGDRLLFDVRVGVRWDSIQEYQPRTPPSEPKVDYAALRHGHVRHYTLHPDGRLELTRYSFPSSDHEDQLVSEFLEGDFWLIFRTDGASLNTYVPFVGGHITLNQDQWHFEKDGCGNFRPVVALILIAAGIFACSTGYGLMTLNNEQLEYEPTNAEVDLSVTGEYQVPFEKKYRTAHGKQFRFEMQPGFASRDEMLAAFADFKTVLVLKQAGGKISHERELSLEDFSENRLPGCEWTAPMEPNTPSFFISTADIKRGETALTLTVLSPAQNVESRQQRLVVKNVLCRMQSFSEFFGGVFIFVGACVILGGLLMVRSFVRSRRAGPAGPHH